jgi:hypothetical protein
MFKTPLNKGAKNTPEICPLITLKILEQLEQVYTSRHNIRALF